MKFICTVWVYLLSVCSVLAQGQTWETIFNGKDLTGWTIKISGQELNDNYKNTFRVVDGKLVVSYDEYVTFDEKFGHIFYDEKLSHFKLRLEYRFIGDQVAGAPEWAYKNSGVKFHSQPPEDIPKDQRLLVAIEAQLLGGNGTDPRPTGNVCTAGTHIEMNGELITEHCINSTSETFHDDQWVSLEIEVHGNDQIIHRINGRTVLEYSHPQLDDSDPFSAHLLEQGIPRMLKEGYIALQAESHPVEFRNIQLLRLQEADQ
ncbi:3-keto-disaccharide hydrolase [Fulvivirga sedimenti]|uniref:DUF1080 domain-containing protein n=1 Tax=Fulvivirga sedimenti TaxID=2879465 RepID=A0A9X1HS94_9BACT|nr:DUF1080 domain-containing protein [Fulvivirga sedimenti]MCA6075089.1 DUF1080 domain-containing protein [Fulvivirga sedimenti]MCA6076266.1 DUF1080 domain-containing protein [Fulvivirga sedimenti]MCA6077394.1 DUF1080 domain-containing protein [Fulvivirga sedimenti]